MPMTLGMLSALLQELGLEYVGGQVGGQAGSATSMNITFALTGGIDSKPSKGDIVIVAQNWVNAVDVNFSFMAEDSPGRKYTQLADLYANDTYDTNLYAGYKIMGDVPDTSVNFGANNDSSSGQAYVIHVWRNVDPDNPLDVAVINNTGTSTGYPVDQDIETLTPNAICIFIAAAAAASSSPLVFGNNALSNFLSAVGNTTYDAHIGIGSKFADAAGLVDDGAWINGPTSNSSNSNANCYLALRAKGATPEGIYFVGASTGSQNAENNLQVKPLTNLTGGFRGAVQPGDLVILSCGCAGTMVTDVNVSSPGWTKLTSLYANDSRDTNLHMFWKVMGNPADTEVIFQRTTGTVNDGSWVIYAVAGIDPNTPFDVNAVTNTGIDSGQPNPPGITPVNAGTKVLAVGASTGGLSASTEFTSSDLNNFRTVRNDDGSVAAIVGVGLKDWVSGLSDPATFGGGSTSTSDCWCARTMALRIHPLAPSNTVAPSLTGAIVGVAATCLPGTWVGYPTPSLTYQWKMDGEDLVGETSQTYTPLAGDVGKTLSCTVTGTNDSGATSATTIGDVIVLAEAAVYVGGQRAGRVGGSGATSVNFALTGGIAAVPAAGDIVIIAHTTVTYTEGDRDLSIEGYTEISDLRGDDTYDANFGLFYKVMGPVPDTSVMMPWSGNAAYASAYAIHVWRNIDPATPLDVAAVNATGANLGAPDPGAITPVTQNAVIIAAGGGTYTSSGGTPPFTSSDLENFISVLGDDDLDVNIGMGSRRSAGGAFDPAAFGGVTGGATDSWAATTIALRPINPAASPPSSPFVSAASALTSEGSGLGMTISQHQIGDLILLEARDDNDWVEPPLPSGWTMILSGGSSQHRGWVAYKIAQSANEVVPTLLYCNTLQCAVYRGFSGIGASATAQPQFDVNSSWPGLTLQAPGTSWVVSMGTSDSYYNLTPGLREDSTSRNTSARSRSADSNGPVSSWPSAPSAVSDANSMRVIYSIELKV